MGLTLRERNLKKCLVDVARRRPGNRDALSKAQIRRLHVDKRISVMSSMNGSFENHLHLLRENLARPCQIDITRIAPEIQIVESDTPAAQIFTAASLLWSVPVSRGFGRRMRFLVKDRQNDKIIGIIGLTDPVFNLTPRDSWVGWNSKDRAERLVHVMDAFVLGAVPPYSRLLGGKLVALLATSSEIVKDFRVKYRSCKGIISESNKDPHLVLLTTSSALGRSSLYNRLRIPDSVEYLTEVEMDRVPTWYTQGYGHFHISNEIFQRLQQVLVRRNHPYATGNRFGDGPNWKIRVIRKAAEELGVNPDILLHGIRRQVYVVPLASNTRDFLRGKAKHPCYITQDISQIAYYWRTRWALPRSERCPEWRSWNSGGLICHLFRLHNLANAKGERSDGPR